MLRSRACSLVTLAALALGCGSASEPAAPTPVPAPAPPPASASAVPVAPETPPPPPTHAVEADVDAATSVELDAAARARVRDAVRAGRAASREGRHDAALASFRQALALDVGNRRLRCEAGYVAHLGGHDAEAETLIDAALAAMPAVADVPDDLRVAYAQCLYNAGLVYQANGNLGAAREAWTQSLTLRPNATVQQHLDALPAPIDVADESAPALGLTTAMATDAIGDALVRFQVRHHALQDYDDPDTADVPEDAFRVTPIEGAPAGTDAWLFDLDPTLRYHDVVLVVRSATAIAAFLALEVDNPGALGIWSDGSVRRAAFVDLVPGGSPELVLDTEDGSSDDDLGGCVNYGVETTSQIVCSVEGRPICAAIPRSYRESEHCDPDCIVDWDEHCGRDLRPPAGDHDTRGYSVDVAWREGRASVNVAVDRMVLPPGLAGTHTLADLFRIVPLAPL